MVDDNFSLSNGKSFKADQKIPYCMVIVRQVNY